MDHVLTVCRQRGEPYGLRFGERPWLSNSRLALEAAEYARDKGRYDALHHAVFKAYFSDGEDIGDMGVLLTIAASCGLDTGELERALDEGHHSIRVSQGTDQARQRGVTAVPTFFIEDAPAITGAMAEKRFREVLREITTT